MVGLLLTGLIFVFILAIIIGMGKTFAKAGQPGWACIVPIYNLVCMLNMAGKPVWWLAVILFVPLVGLVFLIMTTIEIAKRFGQGAFTGLLMAFGLGWIGVGFGDAQYNGAGGGEMQEGGTV